MEWLVFAGIGLLAYYLGRQPPAAPAHPAPSPSPGAPVASAVFGLADDGVVQYTPAAQKALALMMQTGAWVALITPESVASGQVLVGPPALFQAQGADISNAPPALVTMSDAAPSFDIFLASSALTAMPAVVAFTPKGHIPTVAGTGAPPVARTVADAAHGEVRLVRFTQQGDVFILS